MVSGFTKVWRAGQTVVITIPAEVQEVYGIKSGQLVSIDWDSVKIIKEDYSRKDIKDRKEAIKNQNPDDYNLLDEIKKDDGSGGLPFLDGK